MRKGALTRIAEACLEAPLRESPWHHVASALAREIGERRIVILSLAPGWSPIGPSFIAGLDPDSLTSVAQIHHAKNPWARISRRYRSGYFGHGYDEFSPDEMRKGPFYNEWMVPSGLASDAVYGGFPVLRAGVDELLMVTMGRDGAPALEDGEVAICRRAMGLLARTFLVCEKLATTSWRERADFGSDAPLAWSARVLDTIRLAAFVVDAEGRVEYTNEAASGLLDEGVGVEWAKGQLALAFEWQTRRLREIVAQAASCVEARGGALVVERSDGTPGPELIVTPLPAAGAGVGRALILAAPRAGTARTAVDVLQRSFGLTRAEARLTARLAEHFNLRDAASAEQISYETARTYFKRAAEKLGVRSQAAAIDRVRLLGIAGEGSS